MIDVACTEAFSIFLWSYTFYLFAIQVQMLTDAWEYTSDDHFLHCLPLHHIHKHHDCLYFSHLLYVLITSVVFMLFFLWASFTDYSAEVLLFLNFHFTCPWAFQCFISPSLCRFEGNFYRSLLMYFKLQ